MEFGKLQRTDSSWNALLICADRTMAGELASVLPPEVRLTHPATRDAYLSPQAVTSLSAAERPDLCFLDFHTSRDQAFQLLSAFAAASSSPPVVALLSDNDPDLILRCLRRGAAGFVLRPFRAEEIRTALLRIAGLRAQSGTARATAGRILCVIPAKGSCGATTVASNLACHMKGLGAAKVLLADMDPIASTLPFVLKLQPQYSFVDALSHSNELDADLWKALVTPYRGIDVLPSPETPSDGVVDSQDAGPIVEYARLAYEIIVIDLGGPFGPWNAQLVNLSEEILMVLTPELPCVFAAQRALAHLERKGIARGRIRILVNRDRRDAGLERGEIETALGGDVLQLLPNDPEAIERALMEGRPVAPGSPFGKSLGRLAARLNRPESAQGEPSGAGGLLSRFSR